MGGDTLTLRGVYDGRSSTAISANCKEDGYVRVISYGSPMLSPEQAVELGTYLINHAWAHTSTRRNKG